MTTCSFEKVYRVEAIALLPSLAENSLIYRHVTIWDFACRYLGFKPISRAPSSINLSSAGSESLGETNKRKLRYIQHQ